MSDGGRRLFSRRDVVAGLGAAGVLAKAGAALGEDGAMDSASVQVRMSVANVISEGPSDVMPMLSDMLRARRSADARRALELSVFRRLRVDPNVENYRLSGEVLDVPRSSGAITRQCLVIPPSDAALFLALALAVGAHVRPYREQFWDNTVHSYKLKPSIRTGRLFDSSYGYRSFRAQWALAKDLYPVSVKCDVKQFYPSISTELLARDLTHYRVNDGLITQIVKFIDGCSQYTTGLPIGHQASRILAEVVMMDVDVELRRAGIRHVRFVDDFILLAADRPEAESMQRTLSSILAFKGLALNEAKTEILEKALMQVERIPPPSASKHHGYKNANAIGSFRRPYARELQREFPALQMEAVWDRVHARNASLLDARRAVWWSVYGDRDPECSIDSIIRVCPSVCPYVLFHIAHHSRFLSSRQKNWLAESISNLLCDYHSDYVSVFALAILAQIADVGRLRILAFLLDDGKTSRGAILRQAIDGLVRTGGIPSSVLSKLPATDRWTQDIARCGDIVS